MNSKFDSIREKISPKTSVLLADIKPVSIGDLFAQRHSCQRRSN